MKRTAAASLVFLSAACGGATIQMPPGCTTPDGMAVDPKGRLAIAAPNIKHDRPGAIYRIDAPGAAPVKWFEVPPLKESGYSQPMGLCFGADGEMYICDCQKAGQGRLLRVAFSGDRPAAFETVAEGLANANGVKYLGGRLYMTQAFMPDVKRGDGAATSGLYMFDAADRHVRPSNTPADAQCVFSDVTRNTEVRGGLNGVAVGPGGTLYTGNYGDGHVWKLVPGADGRIAKSELFVPASAGVKTPDGLCTDGSGNLYIADMFGDAAVKVTPQGAVSFVKKGGFVRPSEPCFWRGVLYVANWGGTTLETVHLEESRRPARSRP